MAPSSVKSHFVRFGPAIPIVPVTNFSKMKLTEEQWAQVWSIVGPSAEKNMRSLEMWKIIAAAYLEGLHHGFSVHRRD